MGLKVDRFHTQCQTDDTVVDRASAKDKEQLLAVLNQYKANVESNKSREAVLQQTLNEAKTKQQKLQAAGKTYQRNATIAATILKKKKENFENAKAGKTNKNARQTEAMELEQRATRVKDVLGGLHKAAERRREQSHLKRRRTASSDWAQTFPTISTPLKTSLWHRMHRRKQQIVLRPAPETMVNELLENVVTSLRDDTKTRKLKMEDELTKAEQFFLLATHPVCDGPLPSVPPPKNSDDWAEPGWKLRLEVPTPSSKYSILPRQSSFPVLQTNLAEIASAPGRQAASLLTLTNVRGLASPLSTLAIAASPAEPHASPSSLGKLLNMIHYTTVPFVYF